MTSLSDMLVYLRKRNKLSQQALADKLGMTRSAIGMYETGKREPSLETLEIFADFYNIDMDTLMGRSAHASIDHLPPGAALIDFSIYHKIPILGRIAAGLPMYAEENIEGYILTEFNSGSEYFALRVRGDSMNAVRIDDGDIITVRRQEKVEDGEIAVVLVNDEDATVKRFYHTGSTVTLLPQSTNPSHTPQLYDLSNTRIKILGKVVKAETYF